MHVGFIATEMVSAIGLAKSAPATVAATILDALEAGEHEVLADEVTTAVKAKMAEDKTVSATAISVETLNGTVQLSGFAKSPAEKAQAEFLARNTKGVREVRNNLAVRP